MDEDGAIQSFFAGAGDEQAAVDQVPLGENLLRNAVKADRIGKLPLPIVFKPAAPQRDELLQSRILFRIPLERVVHIQIIAPQISPHGESAVQELCGMPGNMFGTHGRVSAWIHHVDENLIRKSIFVDFRHAAVQGTMHFRDELTGSIRAESIIAKSLIVVFKKLCSHMLSKSASSR